MLQVFYCKQCKTNVFEDEWDADKQKCKRHSRRHKYNARKALVDGHTFASQKESHRYSYLKSRLNTGEITDLQLQPPYDICINGQRVARYFADFQYREIQTGQTIIEDVKSSATRTAVYRLKKKLVEALYGISITEV